GPLPKEREELFPRSGDGKPEQMDQSPLTSAATSKGFAALPLEVFVHGALCVAYSGQCLTSEALGGRSANRGECAQACRMPYELISDGNLVPLGDRKYLLSPQDLAGIEVLPDLVRAGVRSLKIEGRLKSPEYVANITRAYRQALDRVMAALNSGADAGPVAQRLKQETSYDLEMAFSRGLYTGWFRGINNQELAHARFGKKRGVYLGEVARIQGERVQLKLEAPLKPGDGVVFDAGHPDQGEEGGRVYAVQPKGSDVVLSFGHDAVDFSRVHVGDKLWKTSDPELDRRLRQTFTGEQPQFQRPITMETHGLAGQPLTLVMRDEQGNVVQVQSAMPLAVAEKQPLTTQRLKEQLGRLGGTPFALNELYNLIEGAVMLPVSELNRLRRDAVAQLEALRTKPKRWTLADFGSSRRESALIVESPPAAFSNAPSNLHCAPLRLPSPGGEGQGEGEPHSRSLIFGQHVRKEALISIKAQKTAADQSLVTSAATLIVLVRNLEQLEAALRCGVTELYCDFEDPKKYREAVRMAHESFGCAGPEKTIWVAPPRIFKMGEEWILNQVRSCNADGYLIRNYDHLKFFADCRRRGDFSLNVANPLAAEYFIERYGLERVTASYDLNIAQLEALLQSAPPQWFEITIHQHMPMFHMEHCVFCAFLSSGKDYRDCGRPCDKHQVSVRDRVGAEHPLKADVGCRNTVFNARAQTGAEYVSRMTALGARHFRVEFVNETPAQVTQTIAKYRQLLRGEMDGARLWKELKLLNQLGVTRGQMG
ncbi:MAG: DUF3656 domain-containing protein, partial [Verrucomicrobiota bacterium]